MSIYPRRLIRSEKGLDTGCVATYHLLGDQGGQREHEGRDIDGAEHVGASNDLVQRQNEGHHKPAYLIQNSTQRENSPSSR